MFALRSPSHSPRRLQTSSKHRFRSLVLGLVALPFAFNATVTPVYAGPGTATPPIPGSGFLPLLGTRPAPLPFVIVSPQSHGFTTIGFIQSATVDSTNCPNLPKSQWGGTAIINDITITIPCNMVVQLPAATMTWADMLDPQKIISTQSPPASLTLASAPASAQFAYPSTEITVNGNVVAGQHIAGLVFVAQQSLNTGTGFITGFDYSNGTIFVSKTPGGRTTARLQINDPKITDPADPAFQKDKDSAHQTGRYSAGQTPDSRFSVDQQNPTIHASTGYPMCIPRSDPNTNTNDDPLCPQKNRPKVNLASPSNCRNFADANVTLPTAREIGLPVAGQVYCSGFVMKAPFGTLPTPSIPANAIATKDEPDSRLQAPFEIGDLITWSGTLLKSGDQTPGHTDTISVNTINANVGIFTQPGSLPVYLAIGNFSMSAESPLVFNGVIPQEPLNRVVVEAFVTDVTSIVDIYLVDIDPNPNGVGAQTQRWITPANMTGGIGATSAKGLFIDGGITTQFTGLVPGRVRLQATKSVPLILASPTRNLRVVARSLCDPDNINGQAPLVGAKTPQSVSCLTRAPAANGLLSGQYMAPEFNFIFPENAVAGDPRVPYDFWDFGFLVLGEGPATGPLTPKPW